jgi:hypothetical protein
MARKPKQSTQFKLLCKNLIKLEKIFLSMKMKLDGSYTLSEQAMIRAYGLLAHAEFEYYFENVASEVVMKAYKKWTSDKKPSHILMSVTSFMEINKKIPENVSGGKINTNEEGNIGNRVLEYINKYNAMIANNNGIKEIDLLKILLPLGIHLNDIDPTFLISIDSFGRGRGEIAHKSIKVKILIDPFAKKKEVTNILTEIVKLDNKIISLK